MVVLGKKYSKCDWYSKRKKQIPFHNCPQNHFGSSKSMESLSAVELLKIMHKQKGTIDKLIADDDSTF